jgi:hypothetical protein
MPRVTGTTIETLRYNAGGLYTASAVVDAAGSTFECYAVNDGTNSGFAKVLKKSGTGAVLADLEVVPYGGMKIDGACIVQSGVDIHVYLVSHMPGAQSPEILTADKYVWRGVAAPYAAGEPQVGADGAYMPEEGQQGGEPVDYDRIEQIVRGIVTAEVQRAVDNMKPKAAAALREADVLTVPMFNGPAGRAEVYEQLVNTSYTGALGALREVEGED